MSGHVGRCRLSVGNPLYKQCATHIKMQTNDTQLTSHEKCKLKIPEYARAFWNQAPMMQSATDTDIMITYDKDKIGHKAYALFDSIASFYKDIRTSNCNAYELIQENKRCPLHLDVEWYGLEDVSREQLGFIVHELREYCLQELNRNIDINVLVGSRLVNGNFKNSYHIASPTVVFDNNQDGTMKEFVDGFRKVAQFDFAPNGCVDMSIYTKNRNMRLPHCCKFGSDVPFIRISNDAFEDDFTGKYDDPLDEDSYAPFILTNPEINGDVIQVHSSPSIQSEAQVKSKKRPKDNNERDPTPTKKFCRNQLLLPFQLDCLRELLVNSGDNVSVPTKACYLQDEKKWQVQCDQSKQLRNCLAKPDTIHTSNNCLLFVSQWDSGFRVSYHCTASECASCIKPVIGYINFVDWDWMISVLPMPTQPVINYLPITQTSTHPLELVDIHNPVLNTYELVKQRHELECFKMVDPSGMYCRIISHSDFPRILNQATVRSAFIHVYYYEKIPDKGYREKCFIDRWIRDKTIKIVNKVVVDPICTDPNVYNIWQPFKAALLPAVDVSLLSDFVRPFVKHIHDVITDQNMKFTDFMLDFFANMLQHPERKSQVAISLFGAQGCGKGILFDLFREEILGPFSSFQTDRPEQTLIGTHANGFIHRVCVQVDEVKCLHDHNDNLKNFITSSTLSHNGKNKDAVVVANLTNLILTSNNENALSVPPDDRRFVLFRCSSVYKDNDEYFGALSTHIRRPEAARGIYQYLMSRDLCRYSNGFQPFRPITEFYKETRLACIPVIFRFISGVVKSNIPCEQRALPFYSICSQFFATGNYKHTMTIHAFGREISRIPGVQKCYDSIGTFYRLDKDVIKKYLETTHRYDEDAEI